MKIVLALALLLGGTSCAPHVTRVDASTDGQAEFKVILMGPNIAYLLDPRSESCLLVYGQTAAASVDCAKIARNVPEARAFITWVPREESDAVVPESQAETSPGAAEEAPSPE